jgi:hypothetical protein
MPSSKPPMLVAVVWLDANRTHDVTAAHEIEHRAYKFTTVGLRLRSDEAGVSIAGEMGEDGKFRDIDFIPRGMIVEEYEIGVLRRRRGPRARVASGPSGGTDGAGD